MKRRSATKAEDDAVMLRGKLELAELKNALFDLQRKNASLHAVVDQQCAVIKENTALLCKQRLPPRPYMNSMSKAHRPRGFVAGIPVGIVRSINSGTDGLEKIYGSVITLKCTRKVVNTRAIFEQFAHTVTRS